MDKKYNNMAMVEIAYELIKQNNGPVSIYELFEEISKVKGFESLSADQLTDKLTTLYMNIVQSGKFVFAGENLWDLKEGNLDLWDNDGSQFIEIIEEEEEDDEIFELLDDEDEEIEELILDEEEEELDEETKKEILEEKEYIEVELPLHVTDEDDEVDFDADGYDEDDYHEIMDDYEDMYDE